MPSIRIFMKQKEESELILKGFFAFLNPLPMIDLEPFETWWKGYTTMYYYCCSFTQSCLCNLMECSTPGFPVLHYLPEFVQTPAHRVKDAIQPPLPLSPPSPPTLNLSQHQTLFQRRLLYWLWNNVSQLILIPPTYRDFPGGSDSKEYACHAGDSGSIPGSGDPLEEGMSPHSGIVAWEISWTEESGGLPSMGSQRVGQDRAANTSHCRQGASSGPQGREADRHLDLSGLTGRSPCHRGAAAPSQRAEPWAPDWRCVEGAKEWSSLQRRAGKWQLASSLFGLISLGTFVKYYLLIRNVQNSPIGVGSSALSALGGAYKWHAPLSSSQRWCSLVWEIIMEFLSFLSCSGNFCGEVCSER